MKVLRLASAALNQTPLAWSDNLSNIDQAIATAKKDGAHVLCLPELCISGYGCEDRFHADHVRTTSLEILKKIIPKTKNLVLAVGLPLEVRDVVFDAVAVIVDRQLVGFVAKQNLAGDGVHYEPRWFKAWPSGVRTEISIDGTLVPVGDLVFELDGVRIGFEICEDAWVANRPGVRLAKSGVDIILNPSSSHFAFGKHQIRERLSLEASRAFATAYVYTNQLGCESGRIIYDGQQLVCHKGQVVAQGERFCFDQVHYCAASVDISRNSVIRTKDANFRPLLEDFENLVRVEYTFKSSKFKKACSAKPDWENSAYHKEEEFCRAEALALFDYMRKSRSKGFLISLSGGVDSSGCAVLVSLMFRLLVNAVGLQKACQHLGLKAKNLSSLISQALICVYQSTENSSAETRAAAKAVAKECEATFFEWSVDDIVSSSTQKVSAVIGRKLSWTEDDLALQNIQARARVPALWMLANVKNLLLLTTSNRSEAAVGYATMDGDTAGGLNPLGGIDKAFLRHWLKWMSTHGAAGTEPFSSVRSVLRTPPTAELRPPSKNQEDEKDLMPYDVLDRIERLAIGEHYSPDEVFESLKDNRLGTDEELFFWVKRFFTLWSVNQWKRERYAPSFHLDDKNLDPKTWCRFPILSGGFARELQELEKKVRR